MFYNIPTEPQRQRTAPQRTAADKNQTYIRPVARKKATVSNSAILLLAAVLVVSLIVLVSMFIALNYRTNMIETLSDEYASLSAANESLRSELSRVEETIANTAEPALAHADRDEFTKTLTGIRSEFAILIDLSTNTVVADKNGDKRIYPASMTKLMTLIVAAEYITDFDEHFTFSYAITDPAYQAGASVAGFLSSESVPLIDVMYGVALPSGADATTAIAIKVAGSEEAFAELMNKKALEIGLEKTHFMNASGLHHNDHYSTPHEMAIILEYAMKIPMIAEILSTYQYTTTPTEQHPEGILLTSTIFSRMYGDEAGNCEIISGKTGYTHEARQCLASMAETPDGRRFVLVTAMAQNRYDPVWDAIDIYKNYIPEITE
ncbi:MAG: D-alanyl-D-alanine carboxypeptidase [Clostridia bacterium]|nr:D-alanyl-D-alanine carboxypeptidase [Clostridia bacterium]MBQ6614447.1 D-alanyl-D-alanine carboxypeptidase [Clostridia bacterium]